MLLQRKNDSRDASSRSRQPVRRAGDDALRVALGAEDEGRVGEDAADRQLHATVEVAATTAPLLEVAEQVGDGLRAHGPPEGPPRDGGDDAPGARRFVGGAGRPALEDASAARCVAWPGGVERALDADAVDARDAVHVHRVDRRAQRLEQQRIAGTGLLEERHANRPRPGLETDANLQTLVDGLGVGRVGEHLAPVVRAADGVQEDAFAVDRELEVVGRDESAREVVVAAIEPGADDVLGVERKMLPDEQAAAGAERQAGHMVELMAVGSRTERLAAGGQLRIAHRERADPFGGGEIPLEQRRGDSQGVGYVVEAVAQLVRRKERGRVHLKRQQVADGIARTRRGSAGGEPAGQGWAATAARRSRSAVSPPTKPSSAA